MNLFKSFQSQVFEWLGDGKRLGIGCQFLDPGWRYDGPDQRSRSRSALILSTAGEGGAGRRLPAGVSASMRMHSRSIELPSGPRPASEA